MKGERDEKITCCTSQARIKGTKRKNHTTETEVTTASACVPSSHGLLSTGELLLHSYLPYTSSHKSTHANTYVRMHLALFSSSSSSLPQSVPFSCICTFSRDLNKVHLCCAYVHTFSLHLARRRRLRAGPACRSSACSAWRSRRSASASWWASCGATTCSPTPPPRSS